MKFIEQLANATKINNSLLCLGLDLDLSKIPQAILKQKDPILNFNRQIIDATKDLVCAYKPNMAFYEMYGLEGLAALIATIEYIKSTKIPVILDAKRGDIGNSSAAYAKSVFEVFKADAVTVNPYMGHDSLEPFIDYKDKGVFVLCLTSNQGSEDFETQDQDKPLYKSVLAKVKEWDKNLNCGLVVGATKSEQLKEIREMAPDMPLLIPGVGAQGGDLEAAVKYGVDKAGNKAIINSSRGIIYADNPREAAKSLRDQINQYRGKR